ncbi:hypothetical protein N7478_008655 [Penicillium angulare]|uniref:uncharacterized protein n=1 Tax=Penicillium angulare TaxID=116970 RepID=UPI0025400017|nr:uncharacterized protein N7478_008655 [Penicillium angulare]KAJ5273530.1 hypothetical protein N7478_008655 [Penicillium angulare]
MKRSTQRTEDETERVRRQLAELELRSRDNGDNEPETRVFRIRFMDEEDFKAAVKMIMALLIYLLGGEAKCGGLQNVFEQHPIQDPDEEVL